MHTLVQKCRAISNVSDVLISPKPRKQCCWFSNKYVVPCSIWQLMQPFTHRAAYSSERCQWLEKMSVKWTAQVQAPVTASICPAQVSLSKTHQCLAWCSVAEPDLWPPWGGKSDVTEISFSTGRPRGNQTAGFLDTQRVFKNKMS